MKLSVAVATHNEESKISACLLSVRDLADEIIVVDGASTDRTVNIAHHIGARIIQTENRKMFHSNKQKALDECKNEWILQLDADEVVTPELAEEIRQTILSKTEHAGFYIPRRNYFWGHFMKKGGQYPDYVMRLVRKGYAWFPCKSVHEQIAINGTSGYLISPMLHYSYRKRQEYWKKADTYTSLTADAIRTKYLNTSKRSFLSVIGAIIQYCLYKPVMTFFSLYIRHKGCADGLAGFEFSLYSALHFPIALFKAFRNR